MSKEEMKLRVAELEKQLQEVKGSECEIYSRIVGYFRPVKQWNNGKQEEFLDRETFESQKPSVKETVN